MLLRLANNNDLRKNTDNGFVIEGDDFQELKQLADEYSGQIRGIIYKGPLAAIEDIRIDHLIINLDNIDDLSPLDEKYQILDPGKTSFELTEASADKLFQIVDTLHDVDYELDIFQLVTRLTEEQRDDLISYYLHNAQSKLKIQPFHAILQGLLSKNILKLWQMLFFDLESRSWLDGDRIGYRDFSGAFVPLGKLNAEGKAEFDENFAALKEKKNLMFLNDAQCQTCRFFYACEGSLKLLGYPCEGWRQVHGKLLDAYHEILKMQQSA